MSKISKVIMWVVIIVIVILLGWWYFVSSAVPASSTNGVNNAPLGAQTENNSVSAAVSNSNAIQSPSSSAGIPVTGLTTSPVDISNAALDSDLSSIDNQQVGLSEDSSNVNQSLSTTTQ
jgi:hypothetical protein